MASSSTQLQGARYFGQASPKELKELEKNAAKASVKQMAKASFYLQQAFSGQYYAWFGGWALKLRGSRRDTVDLDLLVLVTSNSEVRATLAPYSWAIMSYYELPGSIQERLFIDINEDGQVIGVDVVLSGALNTPTLGEEESFEMISPKIKMSNMTEVPVISLPWQVEGKLSTWISRRKESDFQDLVFLFRNYKDAVREWSAHLSRESLIEFYEIYKVTVTDKALQKDMKKTLSLI